MLESLVTYFSSDPSRILTVLIPAIGGSGVLLYWLTRYWNRPRLRVHRITDVFAAPGSGESGQIVLEVENIGLRPTSLDPTIDMAAYTPRGKPYTLRYRMGVDDRALQPAVPRKIIAHTDVGADDIPFLWFRSYAVLPTAGRAVNVRIRNVAGQRLSCVRYAIELAYFRITGSLLVDDAANVVTFDDPYA